MSTPTVDRRTKRNRLYAWGIVPSILLLVFAAKVLLMLGAQAGGEGAYSSEKYGNAHADFARNRTLNVIEGWRAPFNMGDARFADEDYDAAIDHFEDALEHAPDEEECVVRVNLALSHEAIGDASLDDQDSVRASEAWRAGREVLAQGECDTEDSRSTDARLEEKLSSQDEEDDSDKDPEQKQPEQEPDPELEKKKEQLEKRNGSGQGKRKDSQELEDYPYEPDQDYSW